MAEKQIQINTDTGLKDAVISRAEQKKANGDITYAPFGVDDINVKIFVFNNNEWQEWGNLRDFFAEWIAFKKAWTDFTTNGNFLKSGSGDAPSSQNVKLWFDTTQSL